MRNRDTLRAAFAAVLLSFPLTVSAPAAPAQGAATHDPRDSDTYTPDEIVKAGSDFFGVTTEAMAKAVEKAFSKYGRPNAYITGNEGGGAFVVGLRYGDGSLYMKGQGAPLNCIGLALPPVLTRAQTLPKHLRWFITCRIQTRSLNGFQAPKAALMPLREYRSIINRTAE